MQSFHAPCVFLVMLYLATTPVFAQTNQREVPVNQSPQSLNLVNSNEKLHYWLFLPEGYEPKGNDTKWPLMIFLHGHGERGSDLAKVKQWGPPKRVANQPDFPFVVVSPQLSEEFHNWQMEPLEQLVKHSIQSLNVDPKRVYLTGLSMGGRGSWALAAKMPKQFAAVLPICGGGKPETADTLLDLPIWAFHGDADRVVPVSETTRMVETIQKAGGQKVKMTIYPGVRHNSWSQTYANPEIYEWLLQQKRQD